MVSGKWVLFVDSDDWCELDLVQKAVKAAEEKDVDILLFNPYRNIDEDNSKEIKAFPKEFETADKSIISTVSIKHSIQSNGRNLVTRLSMGQII